jgi:hypothetical protein
MNERFVYLLLMFKLNGGADRTVVLAKGNVAFTLDSAPCKCNFKFSK